MLKERKPVNTAAVKTMNLVNNYFAVLCERVSGIKTADNTVLADFIGEYTAGALVRIHGSYSGAYADFGAGEVYEVTAFEEGALTLDRKLHTRAPFLFVVYLEPTSEFMDLCDRIADYETKTAGHEGLASESIDGYSWSAASNGTGILSVFGDELKRYKQPKPTELYYARNALSWG